jgi:3-oxoacyl-[acyl-carrier-protein] synthase-3
LALPEKVRKNDAWPAEFVKRYGSKEQRSKDITATPREIKLRADRPETVRITLEEIAKWESDPFKGSLERRVIDPAKKPSDYEVTAAREAIAKAGLEPKDIDLLMISSATPDLHCPHNGATVHHQLGLPRTTSAMEVDGVCTSPLYQLQLAAACIATGAAKHVLLVQSAFLSMVNDLMDPQSPTLGDAATAMVVGPVSEGRGILGSGWFYDSSLCEAVVAGPKGEGHFLQGAGPVRIQSHDYRALQRSVTTLGSLAKEAIDEALADAGLKAGDVQFYACHQTFAAYNEIVRRSANLTQARTMNTFNFIGSVIGATIPTNLYFGVKEGLLRDGDVTALYTNAAGLSYASVILRWGR